MSSQSSSIGRRGLLLSVGVSGALFALGWGASKVESAPVIRPPGGQDKNFLSKCIRCDRCSISASSSAIICPAQW